MKVSVSQHIDKSDVNENGSYDYYYAFTLYAFSYGEVIYHARSYSDQVDEAHFINGERDGKVFFLSNTELKIDLFIEACRYLNASACRQLTYLGNDGYLPIAIDQTRLKPLLICLSDFYSAADEKAFFVWLNAIAGVIAYSGKPYGLMVDIDIDLFSEESLRDLLALHHRYGLNMQALRMFETPANHTWFRNKNAYWYTAVFEPMLHDKEEAI
jgi:hypothetical protein